MKYESFPKSIAEIPYLVNETIKPRQALLLEPYQRTVIKWVENRDGSYRFVSVEDADA